MSGLTSLSFSLLKGFKAEVLGVSHVMSNCLLFRWKGVKGR